MQRSLYPTLTACVAILLCLQLSLFAQEVPSEKLSLRTKELFLHAGTTEYGVCFSEGYPEEDISSYVLQNWRGLFPHLDELRTLNSGSSDGPIRLIGRLAEEMPPLEYLDFLDAFLTKYEEGKVSDVTLEMQIGGMAKKHYFLDANAHHPRVAAILARARKLVPTENESLHGVIDLTASGELIEEVLLNEEGEFDLPETLPGGILPAPFASLKEKERRDERRKAMIQSEAQSDQATVAVEEPSQTQPLIIASILIGAIAVAWMILSRRAGSRG